MAEPETFQTRERPHSEVRLGESRCEASRGAEPPSTRAAYTELECRGERWNKVTFREGDFYDHKGGKSAPMATTGNNNAWDKTKEGVKNGPMSANSANLNDDLHSLSLMSDISSAELLQRYPSQPPPNNEFVKELYNGLLDHEERKAVFETVCPDIKLLEQMRHEMLEAQRPIDAKPPEEDDLESLNPARIMHAIDTLEVRMANSEARRDQQMMQVMDVLFAIQKKTDTIRDKRMTRPADFDLLPDDSLLLQEESHN